MAFIYSARPDALEFIGRDADFGGRRSALRLCADGGKMRPMYREESDFSRWVPPSRPQTAEREPDDNSLRRVLWEMGLVVGIPLAAATILSFLFPHMPY
jgi:hypothetical protein